jgi:hypothetical protein
MVRYSLFGPNPLSALFDRQELACFDLIKVSAILLRVLAELSRTRACHFGYLPLHKKNKTAVKAARPNPRR